MILAASATVAGVSVVFRGVVVALGLRVLCAAPLEIRCWRESPSAWRAIAHAAQRQLRGATPIAPGELGVPRLPSPQLAPCCAGRRAT